MLFVSRHFLLNCPPHCFFLSPICLLSRDCHLHLLNDSFDECLRFLHTALPPAPAPPHEMAPLHFLAAVLQVPHRLALPLASAALLQAEHPALDYLKSEAWITRSALPPQKNNRWMKRYAPGFRFRSAPLPTNPPSPTDCAVKSQYQNIAPGEAHLSPCRWQAAFSSIVWSSLRPFLLPVSFYRKNLCPLIIRHCCPQVKSQV